MKVTVIVTSYNNEKFVVKCVTSVAAQTYQKIELLFVSNGGVNHDA